MFYKRLDLLKNIINNTVCHAEKDLIEIEESLGLFKDFLVETKENGGMVYCIGNGGSAGIASHFCNDLIKALKIPANTLVDSNVITCLANDFGYDKCYSESLKVNMKNQDLLIAISSSGNSLNIINAAIIANEKKAKVVTLSGFAHSNKLRKEGDLNFWIDSMDYGLVEMSHFFILHTLVDLFYKINCQKLNLVVEAVGANE